MRRTSTATATPTSTATRTATPSPTPRPTTTPTATATPSQTPTPTTTPTATATPTFTVTVTPTATPSPTLTGTATDTSTPTPTALGGCVEPFTDRDGCFGFGGLFNACLGAGQGLQCFNVTASADCCWTSVLTHQSTPCTQYSHDVITDGQEGCGNGTVCFFFEANPCHRDLRDIDVMVGDKTYYTLQFFAFTPSAIPTVTGLPTPTPVPTPFGSCVEPFPLLEGSSLNARLDPQGGTECFDVAAAPECCWVPAVAPERECPSDDVMLTAGRDGACGDGSVCFSYGVDTCVEGTRAIGRLIHIEFGNMSFTAVQAPLPSPTQSTQP